MPARRKYSVDAEKPGQGQLPEHRLRLEDFRAFTPSDGEQENGVQGGLAIGAVKDWSFRPWQFPEDKLYITDAELSERLRGKK